MSQVLVLPYVRVKDGQKEFVNGYFRDEPPGDIIDRVSKSIRDYADSVGADISITVNADIVNKQVGSRVDYDSDEDYLFELESEVTRPENIRAMYWPDIGRIAAEVHPATPREFLDAIILHELGHHQQVQDGVKMDTDSLNKAQRGIRTDWLYNLEKDASERARRIAKDIGLPLNDYHEFYLNRGVDSYELKLTGGRTCSAEVVALALIGKVYVKPFSRKSPKGGMVHIDGYWRTAKPGEKAHAFIDEDILPKGVSAKKLSSDEAAKYGLFPPGEEAPTPTTQTPKSGKLIEVHQNGLSEPWLVKLSEIVGEGVTSEAQAREAGAIVAERLQERIDLAMVQSVNIPNRARPITEKFLQRDIERRAIAQKNVDDKAQLASDGSGYWESQVRELDVAISEQQAALEGFPSHITGELKEVYENAVAESERLLTDLMAARKERTVARQELRTLRLDHKDVVKKRSALKFDQQEEHDALSGQMRAIEEQIEALEAVELEAMIRYERADALRFQETTTQVDLVLKVQRAKENAVKEVLKSIRPMGGVPQVWAKGTSKAIKKMVDEELLDFFPASWLQASVDSGRPLQARKTKGRAKYSHAGGSWKPGEPISALITVSGPEGSQSFRQTGAHEMGHRMEATVRPPRQYGLRVGEKHFGNKENTFFIDLDADIGKQLDKLSDSPYQGNGSMSPLETRVRELIAEGKIPDGDKVLSHLDGGWKLRTVDKEFPSPLAALQEEFYRRRTGTPPDVQPKTKKLGKPYRRNEVWTPAAPDQTPWTDNYMGKWYDRDNFEILTMGMESLLTGGEKYSLLKKDPEMWTFVLGLLVGVK